VGKGKSRRIVEKKKTKKKRGAGTKEFAGQEVLGDLQTQFLKEKKCKEM